MLIPFFNYIFRIIFAPCLFIYKATLKISFSFTEIYYSGKGKLTIIRKSKKNINQKPYFFELSIGLPYIIILYICFLSTPLFYLSSILSVQENQHYIKSKIVYLFSSNITNKPKNSQLFGLGGGNDEENLDLSDNLLEEEDQKYSIISLIQATHQQSNLLTLGEDSNNKGQDNLAVEENQVEKFEYTVQPNDNLIGIAKKFNVNVSSIAGSSDIRYVDYVRVGQKLYIPNQKGFFYKVKKGDKLAFILESYKVSFTDFVKLNLDLDVDFIEVGDEIFLPNAKPKNLVLSWGSPVASRIITSGFGYRRHPWRSYHKGIDLKGRYVHVRSVKPGVVTFAGWWGSYGKAIVINHGNGYKSLYAHLSKIYVSKGRKVVQGRTIGVSGNTGRSTGPHLHFELHRYGKAINPIRYISNLRYQRKYRRKG